jgi:hypothetical protein
LSSAIEPKTGTKLYRYNMIKHYFFFFSLLAVSTLGWTQKYTVSKSTVVFFSEAAIENITAENTRATGIYDAGSGQIAFSIPIKEFEFEKSLMKEHFNEKYMDSEKYPKSTFQGSITGYSSGASGAQPATARGKLTIHGQTKEVNIPGTVEKLGDTLVMKSKFIVRLEDYKIKIPKLMWQNIAEQVEVTLDFTFGPL